MKRIATVGLALVAWLSSSCGDARTSDEQAPARSVDSVAVTGTENTGNPDASSAETALSVVSVKAFYARYTYSQRKGMRLFGAYCAVCHGEGGEGDGFNAFNLDVRPRDLTDQAFQRAVSDEALREVIAQGGRGTNRSVLMPAYQHTLSEEEVTDLLAFIRTLARPDVTVGDTDG